MQHYDVIMWIAIWRKRAARNTSIIYILGLAYVIPQI